MRRSALPVLAAALLAAGVGGCTGSELVWYGHTPDRATRVELRQLGQVRWLGVGGSDQTSGRYRFISTSSIALGPRGRWAFAARRTDGLGRARWHVVTRHGAGAGWLGVAELGFSPGAARLAYAARSRRGWRVVVDGVAQPEWDALVEGSLAFGPDGTRVGYLAVRGECIVPVLDGRPGRCEHDVIGLALGESPSQDVVLARPTVRDAGHLSVGGQPRGVFPAPRGLWVDAAVRHWAVLTASLEPPGWRLVVDGAPRAPADDIDHVTWAPDGRELVYAARSSAGWSVVRGDTSSAPFLRVQRPVFSANGAHVAFIGRTLTRSDVVLDGRTVWSAPTEAAGLVLDPTGERVAWTYRGDSGMILAVGSERFRFDVVVERSLRFTPDGRHWAALVGKRGAASRGKLFITVDGTQELPFDAAELFGGGLRGEHPDHALGHWVEAELSRFLRGEPPT